MEGTTGSMELFEEMALTITKWENLNYIDLYINRWLGCTH